MGGMTGSLLLLLWAGVSVSTMVDLQKRIINGKDCKDEERQYHVKLNTRMQDGRIGLCGGSLISGRWILTAAHCWNVTHGTEIKAILRVHPGDQKVSETIQKNKQHIIQHPTADIMLLRLSQAKTGFPHIDLPNCDARPRNVMVQIAGHAATTAFPNGTRNPHVVPDLKCANIRAIDCPADYKIKHEHIFCGDTTDITNPVGVCKGDSGGGVVYNGRIHGVIAKVYPTICTAPDYYMDVCGYMDWIKLNTAIKPPK